MSADGAFILGCLGPRLSPEERAFFRAENPWGFILFARNVDGRDQLSRLTSELREAVGREAPIFIDQEGGRVARMRAPSWREWLPPLEQMDRTGAKGARAMWLRYRIIAHELRAVGIDGNCAPMADIATEATHPFLMNRCYGRDAGTVTWAARAVADGLLAGGVLPVLKHIPGHGRATLDSHKELPSVAASRSELATSDFAPFQALADLPLGMTAHIVFPAYDLTAPATQSRAVIRAIREEIGFKGLLMTDDLSMEALSGTLTQRAASSIAAGCDIVLHCNGKMHEMEEVVAAAGRLSPEAKARAAAALACRRGPEKIDIPALEAELEALLAGQVNV